ncbi:hypothetical protein E5345_08685 [Propionibacterium sp. NM47_B9-13]|jgi:hypothetical protein|uniref:Uncharacterized protein n=2 Tax=Cutibacterium modestum TaxID=2559073 RepID=A0AAD1KNQ0_9ACTN|nr:hypothetical protein HMPREF9621_02600 [Cutibacterium modestum HL037PA2]EFS92059.1 hypothetical protein HMPREF9607_01687 [Cutibacterium modestum HL044PA1]EFT14155.1 hypothetical protein HMPREF9622_02792 [Cutibacterium modestum HL037PA3]REB72952.1 hypothetical protein CP877_11565 [Cutibacterium modestum]TGY28161.1 hypothetical protein E5345_08685 [Propionibacterium sp. NM47_B9-13]
MSHYLQPIHNSDDRVCRVYHGFFVGVRGDNLYILDPSTAGALGNGEQTIESPFRLIGPSGHSALGPATSQPDACDYFPALMSEAHAIHQDVRIGLEPEFLSTCTEPPKLRSC